MRGFAPAAGRRLAWFVRAHGARLSHARPISSLGQTDEHREVCDPLYWASCICVNVSGAIQQSRWLDGLPR